MGYSTTRFIKSPILFKVSGFPHLVHITPHYILWHFCAGSPGTWRASRALQLLRDLRVHASLLIIHMQLADSPTKSCLLKLEKYFEIQTAFLCVPHSCAQNVSYLPSNLQASDLQRDRSLLDGK